MKASLSVCTYGSKHTLLTHSNIEKRKQKDNKFILNFADKYSNKYERDCAKKVKYIINCLFKMHLNYNYFGANLNKGETLVG